MSDEQRNQDVSRQAKADLEEGKERARQAVEDAKSQVGERLEAQGEEAAGSVDDLAQAVSSAASRLSESEHEGLADYANQLASYLGDFSQRLRDKNVDDLARDVRGIAQKNPALFLLGSVAVGIGLSRFVKASQRDQGAGDGEWERFGTGEAAWRDEQAGEWSAASARPEEGAGPDERITPDTTGGGGL